jgi:hypothetical protein
LNYQTSTNIINLTRYVAIRNTRRPTSRRLLKLEAHDLDPEHRKCCAPGRDYGDNSAVGTTFGANTTDAGIARR